MPEDSREIFISYAWGGESEDIVNKLDIAFQTKGINIIRDKRDLGFKGRIKAFMEKIGSGKVVIVVINEKYLKSENCMFELVQISKNGQFYDRIFPIVLSDANIYKPVQRIKYIQHWESQIQELDEAMKTVGAANLQGFRDDIDLYTEIRATVAELTNILKDMNTLTPSIHIDTDFEALFKSVEQKLKEPIPLNTNAVKTLDDLSSEVGVDYSYLKQALESSLWKDADKITLAIMLQIAGRSKGWMDIESIEKFPCTDLHTIDQLWVRYSRKKFGFSVQKQIWKEENMNWNQFRKRVDWQEAWWSSFPGTQFIMDTRWIVYEEIKFITLAPNGHLPAAPYGLMYSGVFHFGAGPNKKFSDYINAIFSRLECTAK
jgi:GUN4-like/TIR domain